MAFVFRLQGLQNKMAGVQCPAFLNYCSDDGNAMFKQDETIANTGSEKIRVGY